MEFSCKQTKVTLSSLLVTKMRHVFLLEKRSIYFIPHKTDVKPIFLKSLKPEGCTIELNYWSLSQIIFHW